MGTNASMKFEITRYAFLFFVLISGCSKDKPTDLAYTLSTGVSVEYEGQCSDDGTTDAVSISGTGKEYRVAVRGYFSCDTNLRPYLTESRNNRVTLVLDSVNASASGCECRRNIKVKLTDRLEKGQVLYAVYADEVIGHSMAP